MLEAVLSLKTFLFMEWHYAELAGIPGFTPVQTQHCLQGYFFVPCPLFTKF
jgi:hypothetical protein